MIVQWSESVCGRSVVRVRVWSFSLLEQLFVDLDQMFLGGEEASDGAAAVAPQVLVDTRVAEHVAGEHNTAGWLNTSLVINIEI